MLGFVYFHHQGLQAQTLNEYPQKREKREIKLKMVKKKKKENPQNCHDEEQSSQGQYSSITITYYNYLAFYCLSL